VKNPLEDTIKPKAYWFSLILIVVGLKLLVFLIDPLPMFYFGDSWSYLSTALYGLIPADRSFIYGFLIRFTAVASHSLTTLILIQVVTSAANAVILSYILRRFFSVTPKLSFVMGLLCAIEPLQLMYERYVMTEAFSLFLFVLYILLIFFYLEKPRLKFLALFQVAGVFLIGLRLSFLPLVLLNTVCVPLLTLPVFLQKKKENKKAHDRYRRVFSQLNPFAHTTALHVIVSLALAISLHQGYKQLNGWLSQRPPAYQYQSGIFLLAFLGPIVEPVDFPYPELRDDVFADLKYDLKDRHKRALHHWHPGGLIAKLHEAVPDMLEADRAARTTVQNALTRDPLGVVRLAAATFSDYWNLHLLSVTMRSDRGESFLPDFMLVTLEEYFFIRGDDLPFVKTFTNQYYMNAWGWFLFLLISPFIGLITFFICPRGKRRFIAVIVLAAAVSVMMGCTLVQDPTIRFLHSLGWLVFLILGCFINCMGILRNRRKASAEH
jgi:hypothetical protein